jgi:hypothetical protein
MRSVNKKLLSLYGLKWNPFAAEVPVEALYVSPRLDSFCWRVEQLVGEGGFALVTGVPGVGKSVTLRVLAERLSGLRDVQVGVLSRPQASMADFYREMGELFGVELHPHNRHAGAKVLRGRWQVSGTVSKLGVESRPCHNRCWQIQYRHVLYAIVLTTCDWSMWLAPRQLALL